MNKHALKSLDGFTGTESYHLFSPGFFVTDGVKFLCENAECFWLLNIIYSFQQHCVKDASLRDMQFWHLRPFPKPEHAPFSVGHMLQTVGKVAAPNIATQGGIICHLKPDGCKNPSAYVVCERDNDDAAIVQDVALTDFPFDALPEATVWVAPTSFDGLKKKVLVAYLPSEH